MRVALLICDAVDTIEDGHRGEQKHTHSDDKQQWRGWLRGGSCETKHTTRRTRTTHTNEHTKMSTHK